MKDKCKKFEGLFVFSNSDFESHIEECEDCRAEKQKFERVSELIQEVKPLYFDGLKRNTNRIRLLAASFLFLAVLSGGVFTAMNFTRPISDTAVYGEILSAEDYGFPVDSYGFIMVDE